MDTMPNGSLSTMTDQSAQPRSWKLILTICFAMCVVLLVLIGVLFRTTAGTQWLVMQGLKRFTHAKTAEVAVIQGNLWEGVQLENLEFSGITGLDPTSVLRIQQVAVHVPAFQWHKTVANIFNARLQLPYSDPVIMEVRYRDGNLSGNIYGQTVDVREFRPYLNAFLRNRLSGKVHDFDIRFEGSLKDVVVSGLVSVDRIAFDDYSMDSAPVYIDVNIKKKALKWQPFGRVLIPQGYLSAKQIDFKIRPSSYVRFTKVWDDPFLNVFLSTKVKSTDIFLALKGTRNEPDVRLSSQPPLPEERLLLMLLTGTSWDALAGAIDEQRVTAELARDLAKYFLMSGRGNGVAEKLGLKDIKVFFDKETRGVGVVKEILDGVDVGYQIKQKTTDADIETKHTIGGAVKVNKNISLEVDKTVTQTTDSQKNEILEQKSEDKVLLKFKTQF
jgi:autotransporter translocation and assembly factor TamB